MLDPTIHEIVQCPVCGYVDDVKDFDVLMALPGRLHCNHCGQHDILPIVITDDIEPGVHPVKA